MTHAVMAFGRMNPPTTGHEKLIKKVHAHAKKVGGTAHVITSHSQDSTKNPVPQAAKLKYLKKVAPSGVKVSGSDKSAPSIFHQAAKLHKAGHTELTVVAGSDRVKEFDTALNKYNGVKGRHGHYKFNKINVVSSGDRDPDAEGTAGVSGTKMREHAKAGDHKNFKKGLPRALHPHAEEIMSHIKEEEDFEFTDIELDCIIEDEWDSIDWDEEVDAEEFDEYLEERVMTFQQRIKAARRMKIRAPRMSRLRKMKAKRMAPQSRLKYRARKSAISALRKRIAGKRGANYSKLSIAQKITIDRQIEKRRGMVDKIAKRMLPKVRKAEVSRLSAVRNRKTIKSSYDADFANYIVEDLEDAEMYNYRKSANINKRCDEGCGAWKAPSHCKMFEFECDPEYVCDEWYPSSHEGAMESVMDDEENINEMNNYRVEIPGFPDMFLPGKGPADVKLQVRKLVKPSVMKEIQINRIVDAEIKKVFRLRAQGKEEKEENVDEEFDSFVNEGLLKPTASAKAYQDQMDNTHALIYPKKQAIKWKTKPPKGTKNIHPDSPYLKSKTPINGKKKTNEDAETEGDDSDRAADFKTHKYRDPRSGKWFDKKVKKKLSVDKVQAEGAPMPTAKQTAGADKIKANVLRKDIKKSLAREHQDDDRLDSEFKQYDEARRGRPKKGGPTGDEDSGAEHIVMQLRKSVSLRGQKHVEFADGKKHKVSAAHAQKALSMHNTMNKTADKERFTKHMNMSHSHFQGAIAGKAPPKKRNPLTLKKDHSWMDHEKGHMWKEDFNVPDYVRWIDDVDEAALNTGSVPFDDLMRLFAKAMQEKPGSSQQKKYTKEIDKVKKSLGIKEGINLDKAHTRMDNEEDRDKVKHQRSKNRAKMKDLNLKIAAKESLMRKAAEAGIGYKTVLEVYHRGIDEHHDEQKAFDRVNSFINKGEAINIDSDLVEEKE
jgi:hypothetical protein